MQRKPLPPVPRRCHGRAALALAAFLLAPLTSALAADPFTLDALMGALARNAGGRASFVEKKELALLNTPVESSGEIEFVPPSRLVKRTVKPRPESMVVDGDRLVFERGDKRYDLSLAATPEAAAFVDSIRGTLAGDRQALERTYKLRLEGQAERWALILFPRLARMQALVAEIRIEGRRGLVQRVIIEQADGDRSTMLITPIAP
jgi:hypothetical protein